MTNYGDSLLNALNPAFAPPFPLAEGISFLTLAQTSHDALGRPDCTATRMNPATFVTPPASAFNHASRMTTRCEDIDGTYHVVFNADGFDD